MQEQYLKSIEAEDVDNCAAKVNIDDECSRFFTFNDKSQDCGCLTNSDDRFKKEDASDCSIYKINPNPWLNMTGNKPRNGATRRNSMKNKHTEVEGGLV